MKQNHNLLWLIIGVLSLQLHAVFHAGATDGMTQQIAVSWNFNPNQSRSGTGIPGNLLGQLESTAHTVMGISLSPSSWINKKTIFFSAATILGIYSWLCYECVQAKTFLSCPECWLTWRSDWSFQVLASLPVTELARDIMIEMKRRYAGLQNPQDAQELIRAFYEDIDQESKLLAHYAKTLAWVRWINLYFVFPIEKEMIVQIDTFAQRLAYLKQVVTALQKDNLIALQNRSVVVPAFGD